MAEKNVNRSLDDKQNQPQGNAFGPSTLSTTATPSAKSKDSFLLLSYLDEVDDRIKDLKRRAEMLQQDRDSLLTVISQLKAEAENESQSETESVSNYECQDLLASIRMLQKRCESVDVRIHVYRSPVQEEAYQKVEDLVGQLERVCMFDEIENEASSNSSYQNRAQSFLNACSSDCNDPSGAVDYKFQGLVLDCKLEDQKIVRRRLECLVNGRCHENYVESHIGHALTQAAKEVGVKLEGDHSQTADNNDLGS